jgi:tetratricopeptide (TPR) repeat protein
MVYFVPKAALIPLRRAVGITPNDINCWLALGRALHAAGQIKEALQTLQAARDICGNHEDITALMLRFKLEFFSQAAENRWHSVKYFSLKVWMTKILSIVKNSKSVPKK